MSSRADPLRTEVAVVGSGPGGSVVAHALVGLGFDVTMIEEGPELSQQSHSAFGALEMANKYRNGGLAVAFGNPKINYAEGRCLGGGSEVNAGIFHRLPDSVADRWRSEFLVDGLDSASLRRHFDAIERELGLEEEPEFDPEPALRLRAGAKKLGWKTCTPRRLVRNGSRRSMSETLIPAARKSGLKVLADTRVVKLSRASGRWELRCRGARNSTRTMTAESVFVCCGATGTPALLRRSGISRIAGRSLQIHPTLNAVAVFDDRVNFHGMGVPSEQVNEFSPKLLIGCSASSPGNLAASLWNHPRHAHSAARDWERMAKFYVSISPEGSGSVTPIFGFDDPLVRHALTESDWKSLSEGLRKLCKLLLESGAREVVPCVDGLPPVTSVAGLNGIPETLPAGGSSLMTVHLFASCPMGEDRDRCVADSFGKVHGTTGLYLADASMLCSSPGVNPQGTIMALARRNAYRFAGREA